MGKIQALKNGSRKDLIVKNAAALFRKKGFAASSMRELAITMGIEAPSLYNHIGSKNELLQAVCFNVANRFNDHLDTTLASAATIIQKLDNLIRFHIRMMLDEFDEVIVANHEWKQLEEPLLTNFLSQRKKYENRFVMLIREGINEGQFKNIHPHVATLTILSAVRGLEFWQRHKKELSIEELENNMVQHLLKGLIK
ncbi:MAG: TetR/AcrR family transcriptional regulator [Ferruginibacter sp.]